MPTLFEIHVTTTELDETLIREFVDFCDTIEAKPILIELPAGQQRQQPMISKVVKLEDPQEIHPIISDLEAAFLAAGFPVERVKVEVPLEFEVEGSATFPEFRGKYYEWHGRVKNVDPAALTKACLHLNVHVSRNALKGKSGTRIVTMREVHTNSRFTKRIQTVKSIFKKRGFQLEKEEAEYCVFDSNKTIDRGWSDVPEYTDYAYATQLAIDGFMRRVALAGGPFMAKGSVIMRQYLPDPTQRPAEDVDFVYLDEADEATAASIFTNWLIRVTEIEVDDGIIFRSFSENAFWRGIDYAMNDDFPTTNTDLLVTAPGSLPFEIGLDISWNLPLPEAPVVLLYMPIEGEPFELKHTVPLSLQISWKLHQTVVRPRMKDLTDLITLLAHPLVTQEVLQKAVKAYEAECKKDGIPPGRLGLFVAGNATNWRMLPPSSYFPHYQNCVPDSAEVERYDLPEDFRFFNKTEEADTFLASIEQLGEALRKAGIAALLNL